MQMTPYLSFNGNCEAAFNYYTEHLGGQIQEFHRYGNSPMAEQVPAEFHKRVMHVRLSLSNGQMLMASDAMPGQPFDEMKGIQLALNVDSVAEAEKMFNALAVNGNVTMPLQKTFWAERFAMLIDQFGTPWMINLDQQAA
ncbi:MAG: VOC family protein [Burkholderiales bacterium]|nr:VOC family protein [Burkholderiales bacterium]